VWGTVSQVLEGIGAEKLMFGLGHTFISVFQFYGLQRCILFNGTFDMAFLPLNRL
jgi:hypothetical protein